MVRFFVLKSILCRLLWLKGKGASKVKHIAEEAFCFNYMGLLDEVLYFSYSMLAGLLIFVKSIRKDKIIVQRIGILLSGRLIISY